MDRYNLSYIIATRNRLPFLKITLPRLIQALSADEEIVVVDGNSTDGSKEYLQQLFTEGKIHQFISEPDKNQAHAWNKAMLLATGTLIKKVIDDDVFCYEAIKICKAYMLKNQQVDVLISNDLGSSIGNSKNIQKLSRLPQFEKWRQGLTPSFTFGDVHMLIRRKSLALTGLYNTSYVMMDWEYALRISYLKANITYYTGYNALSVMHPQTVSAQKQQDLIVEQGERGSVFYEYPGDAAEISRWSKIKIFIGKRIYKQVPDNDRNAIITNEELPEIYEYYYNYLSKLNQSGTFIFLPSA